MTNLNVNGRRNTESKAPTVVVACLGILIAYLPVVGVPVILGDVGSATGADTAELQWVTASGLLALAVTVLSAGVVADMVGRNRVLISGFGLIATGSVIGVLSGIPAGTRGIGWLYLGQIIIGVGGGALLTSTLALISQAARDQHQRTLFISLWASSLVIGSGLGPFISGVMTATLSWNWIFLPLAVLAALMVPIAAALVPPAGIVPGRRFDVPGQITAAAGVGALVFGVIEGPTAGWLSVQTYVTFSVAIIFIAIFIAVERASAAPLVRLELFRSASFDVAAVAALVILFAIVGIAFALTLFLNGAQGLSVLAIASRVGVLYLFAAVTGPLAAQSQRWVPASVPLFAGLTAAGVGVLLLGSIESNASWVDIAWPQAITGAGVGAVLSTVSAVAIHSAPSHQAGMAGATNTLFRQIGAALGPSVIGTVLATRLQAGSTLVDAFQMCTIVMGVALLVTAAATAAVLLPRRGGTDR